MSIRTLLLAGAFALTSTAASFATAATNAAPAKQANCPYMSTSSSWAAGYTPSPQGSRTRTESQPAVQHGSADQET